MERIDVTAILPVYNEEESIGDVINDLKKVMGKLGLGYEIIAVNDGSTDKTGEILGKSSGIRVINHPYNRGYGSSLKTAIKNSKSNLIIMVDADGTYPLDEIPSLLKYAKDYDMVSGARSRTQIPILRRPAKFILNKLANFLTNREIPDLNCGFRVIKKDNVTQFFDILPSRFSFAITHLLSCLTNDCSVKFVPISYNKRKGKSTIKPVEDFTKFIAIIIRVTTYFNPFKMFATVSILLLLFAIALFFYSLLVQGKIMDTSIVVVLLSAIHIFLFGLLADLTIKRGKR